MNLNQKLLQELQRKAYTNGLENELVWEILTEHGEQFVTELELELDRKFTKTERRLLVTAYEGGFFGRKMPFNITK
jgi:predicted DNA binding protein